MKLTVLATFALLAFTVDAAAADGVLIVQRVTVGADVTTSETQIEKTRMRTEIAVPTGGRQVVIFDAEKQVMYMVDTARKSYAEMTKADVERLSTQLQGAMALVQAQLAKLPPEQRAQIEAAMKDRGLGAQQGAAKTQYTRTGTDKIGRFTCTKYDALQDGKKVGELCTVSPEALGVVPGDLAVTGQMAEFFSTLVPQAGAQVTALGRQEAQGYEGFPVRSTMTFGGRTITSELVDAKRATFDDSQYAVPAGFTRQQLPSIPSGR